MKRSVERLQIHLKIMNIINFRLHRGLFVLKPTLHKRKVFGHHFYCQRGENVKIDRIRWGAYVIKREKDDIVKIIILNKKER